MNYATSYKIARKAWKRRQALARKAGIVAKQVLRTYSEKTLHT